MIIVVVIVMILIVVIVIVIPMARMLRLDCRPASDRRNSYARETRKEYGAIHANH